MGEKPGMDAAMNIKERGLPRRLANIVKTAEMSNRGDGNVDWICSIRVVGGLSMGVLMESWDKKGLR